ncbi:MAG TPA: patatin-like phospholipase family protein [Dehalococcoidia bacterium]|nr:patatin-like phospholipase family protein [Dehalococcoidia bacterium]
MNSTALVLGGGGSVGIAWEIGVLAGLLEGGIDARDADLIVGTSAGSVVGASIAHGRDPRELLEEHRSRAPREGGPAFVAPDAPATFQLWASFDEITPGAAAAIGRQAMRARTMPPEQWLATFTANDWPGWPDKPLLITAVACENGAFHVFDRTSRTPIERAVAASCAVPGLAPPVEIGGTHYMDGGVGSGTSADLAQRIEPDAVIIVAPLGWNDSGLGRIWGKHIAREVTTLESAGARVRLIQPDDAARAHMSNMMDPTQALPAATAGQSHARTLAAEWKDW